MARSRIEEKRQAKRQEILDTAAKLFARDGYVNARMADIAAKCGASKSMLYHYFPGKEDILFELLKEHLDEITASVEKAGPGGADRSVSDFVGRYLHESKRARTRHVVALHDVRFLPEAQRRVILDKERRLLGLVSDFLKDINPHLSDPLYKVYALLVQGMLNWTDVWYRPDGPIPPQELQDRVASLFLHGIGKTTPADAAGSADTAAASPSRA